MNVALAFVLLAVFAGSVRAGEPLPAITIATPMPAPEWDFSDGVRSRIENKDRCQAPLSRFST